MDLPRHRINPNHPVFGFHAKLGDEDILKFGDETACVSCLLSYDGEPWRPVEARCIGKTVLQALEGDMDARERVFRRGNVA